VFPEPTHGAGRIPYRTAADCIDWSHATPSIFSRKTPLKPATLRRIARGLGKFVITNPQPFIVPIAHYNGSTPVHSGLEPLRTITAHPKGGSLAVAIPHITAYHSDKSGAKTQSVRGSSLDEPLKTQSTENRFGLVAATMVQIGYGERDGQAPRVLDIEAPIGTLVSTQKHGLVAASIIKHYGGTYNGNGSSIKDPLHTITAWDQNSLATAHITRQFGTSTGHKMDVPLGTIMAGSDKSVLTTGCIAKYYGTSDASNFTHPLDTITTKDRFASIKAELEGNTTHAHAVYELMKEQAPEYLSETDHNTRTVGVTLENERYIITDVGMRMLQPAELYRAQGFDERYDISPTWNGKPLTKEAQVRLVGNSVCPPVASALVRANFSIQQPLEMAAD
jgi:DNA (cytosine-5)-methyltransferase 1